MLIRFYPLFTTSLSSTSKVKYNPHFGGLLKKNNAQTGEVLRVPTYEEASRGLAGLMTFTQEDYNLLTEYEKKLYFHHESGLVEDWDVVEALINERR